MTAKHDLPMRKWAITVGVLLAFGCGSVPAGDSGSSPGDGSGGSSSKGGSSGTGGKSSSGGSPGNATGGSKGDGGKSGSGGGGGSGNLGGSAGDGGKSGSGGAGDSGGSTGGGGSGGGGGMDGGNTSQDTPAPMDASGRTVDALPMCKEPNKGLDPTKIEITGPLDCNSPGLVWHTANVTNYDSNPAPGSSECVDFNGCFWAGKFNTCGDCLVKTKPWIASHKVVALFPLKNYGLHSLCVKQGGKMVEVIAYDTCGDSDCKGCCTQNKGGADALIDVEKQTLKATGLSGSGSAMWADLGYKGATCTDAP
jgi:hypothetical protein